MTVRCLGRINGIVVCGHECFNGRTGGITDIVVFFIRLRTIIIVKQTLGGTCQCATVFK